MGTNPVPAAQDTWGALSIPSQPGYSFTPVAQDLWVKPAFIPYADPCLCVVLDYLATAINADKIIQVAWQQHQSLASGLVLKRIFCHNPRKVVFSDAFLPALYLWREGGVGKYAADEWYRVTTKVMGLWVFPNTVAQELQKARDPFANALFDGIINTIERGRTPSWLQPGDTDPRASYEGSVFYPYAGFESLFLSEWKPSVLQIGERHDAPKYPAIELRFDLEENQIRGISRFFVNTGITATLLDASGSTVWAGNNAYALDDQVFPTPADLPYLGDTYVFKCTTAGTSWNTPPVWPTGTGDTVQDGSVVWTCIGTMAPNGNQTVSGPLNASPPDA